MLAHVDVQRRQRRPLQRLRRTDERVLLQHRDLVDDRRRAVHEAQPPAGHAVRLAEAVDHDRLVVPPRRARERRVVAELAVDFVADQRDVALRRQLRQRPHFGFARHRAGRIGRAVEQDHLRPRRDRGRHASRDRCGNRDTCRPTRGVPPTMPTSAGYITKYGSKTITSSPGFTSASIASTSAPLVPEVTSTRRSAWPSSASTRCLQLFAQRRRCPA